jgi:glucan 1,3-beta-glucosidase
VVIPDSSIPWWEARPRMRGVNLGGWLLLERWMQESLFAGTEAKDEYGLCAAWGSTAPGRLREHRGSYITRDDFVWLVQHGINAVRIPFGYWVLEDDPPLIACPEVLDRAVGWCEEFGLMAILDLHGLPGGQSPEHHTGRAGVFRWPEDDKHRRRSMEVLEDVAERYAGFACVRGISVVNEPHPSIPTALLDRYYREAYARTRRHLPYERVAVVLPAFPEQRLADFHGRYAPPAFENVITDLHYYQCFGDWYAGRSTAQHLTLPLTTRLDEIEQANLAGWLLIGEWSLRLPWAPRDRVRELPPLQRDLVMRAFGAGQLLAYEQTQGWFFWSYKAENEPEWSFRESVERGWLPDRFFDSDGA